MGIQLISPVFVLGVVILGTGIMLGLKSDNGSMRNFATVSLLLTLLPPPCVAQDTGDKGSDVCPLHPSVISL